MWGIKVEFKKASKMVVAPLYPIEHKGIVEFRNISLIDTVHFVWYDYRDYMFNNIKSLPLTGDLQTKAFQGHYLKHKEIVEFRKISLIDTVHFVWYDYKDYMQVLRYLLTYLFVDRLIIFAFPFEEHTVGWVYEIRKLHIFWRRQSLCQIEEDRFPASKWELRSLWICMHYCAYAPPCGAKVPGVHHHAVPVCQVCATMRCLCARWTTPCGASVPGVHHHAVPVCQVCTTMRCQCARCTPPCGASVPGVHHHAVPVCQVSL